MRFARHRIHARMAIIFLRSPTGCVLMYIASLPSSLRLFFFLSFYARYCLAYARSLHHVRVLFMREFFS